MARPLLAARLSYPVLATWLLNRRAARKVPVGHQYLDRVAGSSLQIHLATMMSTAGWHRPLNALFAGSE